MQLKHGVAMFFASSFTLLLWGGGLWLLLRSFVLA